MLQVPHPGWTYGGYCQGWGDGANPCSGPFCLSRLSWLNWQIPLMRQVNMQEAAAGQAFVICKAGKPMVRVTPLDDVANQPQPRRLGLLRGHCQVPDDFDQLASSEIADLFEGR